MSASAQFDEEAAYFRAQLRQEAAREAAARESGIIPKQEAGFIRCMRTAWGACASIGHALGSLCCCVGRTNSAAAAAAAAAASATDTPAAASTDPFYGAWYAPLLAFCPCCARCCTSRAPPSGSLSYLRLDENGAVVTSAEEESPAEVEMTATDTKKIDSPSHASVAPAVGPSCEPASQPPKSSPAPLSSLPVLASVEKQQKAFSVAIAAPTHDIANKTLFSRLPPPPSGATDVAPATDSPLVMPMDAQRRIELELHDFYANDESGGDGLHASDDAITEDEDDVDPTDDDDDDMDPLRMTLTRSQRRRSLEETPAARRKREAKKAERKRQRSEQQRIEQQEMLSAKSAAAAAAASAAAAAVAISAQAPTPAPAQPTTESTNPDVPAASSSTPSSATATSSSPDRAPPVSESAHDPTTRATETTSDATAPTDAPAAAAHPNDEPTAHTTTSDDHLQSDGVTDASAVEDVAAEPTIDAADDGEIRVEEVDVVASSHSEQIDDPELDSADSPSNPRADVAPDSSEATPSPSAKPNECHEPHRPAPTPEATDDARDDTEAAPDSLPPSPSSPAASVLPTEETTLDPASSTSAADPPPADDADESPDRAETESESTHETLNSTLIAHTAVDEEEIDEVASAPEEAP